MPARGPYAKGVAKRAEILDLALDIIARDGYSGATVRQIADAAGLSQNGLLHYFGSKDALFTEVLRRRDEADEIRGGNDAGRYAGRDVIEGIADLVHRNAELPGFVQLYACLSNEGTEPQHESHEYFRHRYDQIRSAGRQIFRQLQVDGHLALDADVDRLAVLLFAVIDGLQTQWMYDPSVDMADHVRYFFEAILIRSSSPAEK